MSPCKFCESSNVKISSTYSSMWYCKSCGQGGKIKSFEIKSTIVQTQLGKGNFSHFLKEYNQKNNDILKNNKTLLICSNSLLGNYTPDIPVSGLKQFKDSDVGVFTVNPLNNKLTKPLISKFNFIFIDEFYSENRDKIKELVDHLNHLEFNNKLTTNINLFIAQPEYLHPHQISIINQIQSKSRMFRAGVSK